MEDNQKIEDKQPNFSNPPPLSSSSYFSLESYQVSIEGLIRDIVLKRGAMDDEKNRIPKKRKLENKNQTHVGIIEEALVQMGGEGTTRDIFLYYKQHYGDIKVSKKKILCELETHQQHFKKTGYVDQRMKDVFAILCQGDSKIYEDHSEGGSTVEGVTQMVEESLAAMKGKGTGEEITQFLENYVGDQAKTTQMRKLILHVISLHCSPKGVNERGRTIYQFKKAGESDHEENDHQEKDHEDKEEKEEETFLSFPSKKKETHRTEMTYFQIVEETLKRLGGKGTMPQILEYVERHFPEKYQANPEKWKASCRAVICGYCERIGNPDPLSRKSLYTFGKKMSPHK